MTFRSCCSAPAEEGRTHGTRRARRERDRAAPLRTARRVRCRYLGACRDGGQLRNGGRHIGTVADTSARGTRSWMPGLCMRGFPARAELPSGRWWRERCLDHRAMDADRRLPTQAERVISVGVLGTGLLLFTVLAACAPPYRPRVAQYQNIVLDARELGAKQLEIERQRDPTIRDYVARNVNPDSSTSRAPRWSSSSTTNRRS